jgi:hypothetical protein
MLTLILAIGLVFLSLFLIALSLFLTGKMRVKIGACGKFPGKKKGECGEASSCELCSSNKNEEDETV